MSGMASPIRIAAIALLRGNDVLLVRKRGATRFMLPGGKFMDGEEARRCAVREVEEELGLRYSVDALRDLGTFTAPAANEPGREVVGVIFTAPYAGEAEALAEIEALRWQPIAGDDESLAPLLRQEVLPALRLRFQAG